MSTDTGLLLPGLEIPAGLPPLPRHVPRHETVYVTPVMARHWLEHVDRRRPLAPGTVHMYKRDMIDGALHLIAAGECETYGCGNRELLEGRQRLSALVLAGDEAQIPGLWLDVAFDVDPDAMDTINTGRSRSYSDRLAIRGLGGNHGGEIGTICRRIIGWERRGTARAAGSFKASPTEMDAVYARFPAAIDAAAVYGRRTYERLRLPTSALGFAHWLFHQIAPDDATVFMEKIAGDGSNLPSGDPALMFRERVNRNRIEGKKLSEQVVLALLILAWNEMRNRKQHARKRIDAHAAGKRPAKPRKDQMKLQLPDGKLTSVNFPQPV